MSIQQNFPAISPSLNLNFARSKTLDPRITFSRTSTATRVNEQGLVEVVSADIPRFDHKYENGVIKSLGLLVEEQRSNLTKYSNTLQSPFNPVNGTITTNQTTSPSGENNASLLTQTAASTCYVNYGSGQITWTSGQQYTFSCFVKKYSDSDENQIYILGYNLTFNSDPSGANSVVIFNLDTLTSTTASGLVNSHSIDDVGNGWRRISATFTAYTTHSRDHQVLRFVDPGATSNMYVWGYQIEEGAFPTSYIPRPDTSTATRNPDNVSMTGDNFSDWYNQSEGTVFASFRAQAQPSATKYLMGISNNSSGELIYIRATASGSDSAMRDGGSDVAYKPIAYSRDINTLSKHCVSYKQNDFIVSAQGQISTVDDNCTVPTPTNISIGSLYNTTHLGGTISQLTYYPTRLTNTQLQTLTK